MDALGILLQRLETSPSFQWEAKRVLKRGEYLKNTHTTDTNLYFVQEGCLRIFVDTAEGAQIIRFGYSGEVVVALDSFITEQSGRMGIQALRRTEIRLASKAAFQLFLQQPNSAVPLDKPTVSHSNLALWHIVLEQLLYQQMEREIDLLTHSPAERYHRLLARSPQLFQQVPAKYIANYLRMTAETFSRLRKS